MSLVRGGTKSFMRYDDKIDNLTEDGKLCGLFFNISVDEDNIEPLPNLDNNIMYIKFYLFWNIFFMYNNIYLS